MENRGSAGKPHDAREMALPVGGWGPGKPETQPREAAENAPPPGAKNRAFQKARPKLSWKATKSCKSWAETLPKFSLYLV